MDIWARRSDGVEVGLRRFEQSHPISGLAGAWAVLVRPGPGREFVLFGPASEEDARSVARRVWSSWSPDP